MRKCTGGAGNGEPHRFTRHGGRRVLGGGSRDLHHGLRLGYELPADVAAALLCAVPFIPWAQDSRRGSWMLGRSARFVLGSTGASGRSRATVPLVDISFPGRFGLHRFAGLSLRGSLDADYGGWTKIEESRGRSPYLKLFRGLTVTTRRNRRRASDQGTTLPESRI